MKEVAILLFSLIAGGCGYLIVTFWMTPILRYLQIRHDITADLIFFANVIAPEMLSERLKKLHVAGAEAYRRHAAEIAACYYRLPWWYRFLLKKRGENPLLASKNFIGLSNCSKLLDADPHIQWLKKSLLISPELDL
jgi:hypothetical protein